MAFMIYPMAGLIFALVLLLLLIIIVFFMGKIIGMHRRVQQSLDRVQESVSDNLTGARVIRAFGQEEKERSSFRDLTAKHYFLQMMQGNVAALLNPSTLLTINGGILALLYFGGIRVQAGELTGGEVIALVNYMLQILTELVRTAQLTLLLSRAQACSVRVNEVFAIKNSLPLPAAPLFLHRERFEKEEEILAFDRVTFSYAKASRPALSDVSFSLRRGQTLGIIGGTGSGKTTLIQLIPRFYDVSSGSIRIAGRDIREYDLDSLRSFVGLVEQKTRLFEGTIKSNLAWGRPETNEREMECSIDLSQARTVVEAKEKGLNSPVEQKGSNYSGGQKQRLSIARTLIKEAPLLILDDASSALDYLTDRKLRKSLASLSATKIIVSQRVASIRHADCILLLDKGRIAAMGSHSFLLSESALYREICDSQLTRTEVTE